MILRSTARTCDILEHGEVKPEILVATHVLQRPIEVHMAMAGEPLRSIGIYGNEDYGTTKDSKTKLMLLFHGQGQL